MRRLEDRLPTWAQYLIGGILGVLVIIFMFMILSTVAQAYNCTQLDGQQGWLNGTTADDEGCITQSEYEFIYSDENLEQTGVVTDITDNGDGTFSGLMADPLWGTQTLVTVKNDPLDRPVAATPELEPDAPTVREVLFSHPGSGGPQEF